MNNLNNGNDGSGNVQPLGRLMSVKEVALETSLSRTTIFRRVRAGEFPKSIPLGGNRIAWSSTAIEQWKTERAAASLK